MRPEDKPVLITGCSSGIGYHTAHALARRGYPVFATARKSEDVQRLQAEGLESIHLDLDDSVSIKNAVLEILSRTHGRIYGLFNNGAYGQPGAVEDLTRETLRQQFETNLFGTMELTNRLLPVMRQQGYGRIIQNSSVLGLISLPYRGAYNSSKFALEGLTDTLRLELAGSGVHVSLIEPGPIESRFRANAHAMFKKNIRAEQSFHADTYQKMEQRLVRQEKAAPFTLGADAVTQKVIHALESDNPHARYYVTLPTHFFGILRRLLSTRALDRILMLVSRSENR